MPKRKSCPKGYHRDPETGRCVRDTVYSGGVLVVHPKPKKPKDQDTGNETPTDGDETGDMEMNKRVKIMNLSDLVENPLNRTIDDDKVDEIKAAIEDSGLIKPLIYTEVMTDTGRKNMLTDGHHRYIALKELGYQEAPAMMADEAGIDSANQAKPEEVRKAISVLRQLASYIGKRRIEKHPGHADQQVHDPTQGSSVTSKPELVGEYKSEITRLAEEAQTGLVQHKEKELVHAMREDVQRGSLKRPEFTSLMERLRDSLKMVKHLQGEHNQEDHSPTGESAQSRKPAETFGRIGPEAVDEIEQHVPGVKEYYESLPENERPQTATELVTQFEGLSDDIATPVPKKLKTFQGVKDHLGSGTKVMLSAERTNLSPTENKVRTINLKRDLKNLTDDLVMSDSKYEGSREKSYLASIRPEDIPKVRQLARKYNQDSVIVVEDGKARMEFRDGSSMKGNVHNMTEQVDAEDNYSSIGGVKFTIPFDEDDDKKVMKYINQLSNIVSSISKQGISVQDVPGLSLTREDLEGGHRDTRRRKTRKMDMDEGVDTKRPYKNPDGAQIEGTRNP